MKALGWGKVKWGMLLMLVLVHRFLNPRVAGLKILQLRNSRLAARLSHLALFFFRPKACDKMCAKIVACFCRFFFGSDISNMKGRANV